MERDQGTFVTASRVFLGAGSLGFAAWALARPASFARVTGLPVSTARRLGARELLVGTALLARGGPGSYAMRAAADVWDAVHMPGRGHAASSAAAATWALVAATLAARARFLH
jgi:threonine dehydrogenase-like Zn-dependent dehydrogenase